MHWWLADMWTHDRVMALSWLFWVVFSICCHELGHGHAAIRKGDDTPIALGHMTWNPLVHMGQTSLIMLLLCGIAWGQMPVNPNRFRGKHADAVVAAAGPAVNFGLFLTCAVLGAIWAVIPRFVPDEPFKNVFMFLWVGCSLNMTLMLFNLIPVPPLDGSRIAASFYRPYAEFVYSSTGSVITMVLFTVLFFVGGSFVRALGFEVAATVVEALVKLFHSFIPHSP